MARKSTEYLNIKYLEDVLISRKNNDLSIRQKELKKRCFDWPVSVESDKFKMLESVHLPISLASNHKDDEESHERGQEPEVQKLPEICQ
jgi:hypothetical protein